MKKMSDEEIKKRYFLDYDEIKILRRLKNPGKIQSFLNKLPINFEQKGETFFSPRKVLREKTAHCIEGALLAYLALKINGFKTWLVDLKTTKDDFEHVLTVYKQFGKFGAITKTNHGVLRYREPIYNSIKELVMSYFHEYFDNKGKKNLRSYSIPVSLDRFNKKKWAIDEKDLWYIHSYLDKVKHFKILTQKQIANLRKADLIERDATTFTEWDKQGRKLKYKFKKGFGRIEVKRAGKN
jgi:hypothetical protein